ncbi:MAG: hypothetical protein M3364_00190 [Actinomycetota bacterium]|nr:hypothetical protein [Actinomycetota bacterium]
MVGAASLLISRRRALVLAAWVACLVVFGAVASDLPGLSRDGAVVFASLVVLPALTATAWLALPLAAARDWLLLGGTVLAALMAVGLAVLDLDAPANVSKLVAFILFGFWFLYLFEALWWLSLVALLVPWVDIWSVAFGPTKYVTEEKPGVFEGISVAINVPGETSTANIGPPDIVFFALFLAAAWKFRLRVALTWLSMTGLLSLTLMLVYFLDTSGLPALPAVCFGFLLPNLDLLWREVRVAYSARGEQAK